MSSRQVDDYEVHIVDGHAELPVGVKVIGCNAFAGCSFTSVTIPSSVTKIGVYAFKECFSLISVSMSSSATKIGDKAFAQCGITSITIPTTCAFECQPFDPDVTFTYLTPEGMRFFDRLATARWSRAITRCKPQLFAWYERAALELGSFSTDGAGCKRDRDAFERDFTQTNF